MGPKPKGSLRGHQNPITCTAVFRDHTRDCNTLITSDNEGWTGWWDIRTKRPIAVWRSHSKSILTVTQIEKDLLLTHGKDSCVRIWTLEPLKAYSKTFPKGDRIDKNTNPWPHHVEIPVNTLNFCNVSYLNGLLLTPSTQESNNFDIYSIFPASTAHNPDLYERLSLRRLVANADPSALYKKAKAKASTEIDFEFEIGDTSKRDGYGIMMQTVFVSPGKFCIGYESGHVLGFSMEEYSSETTIREKNGSSSFDASLINKQPTVKVTYYSAVHSPHPITALAYRDKLYLGSASKMLAIHIVQSDVLEDPQLETHNLKTAGIQDIAIASSMSIVAFWDGDVRGYSNGAEFNKIWSTARDTPRIDTLESNSGQSNPIERHSKIKANSLCIVECDKSSPSTYKEIVSRRQHSPQLLVAGYADGLVTMYDI